VVIAEASPTIKSVADSLLRQNGYDVVCTSDGLQAWDVISSERPDLVLAGVGLSGISGIQLCKKVAADRLTGGIPLVLMIGAKDSVSEEEIVASGARGKLRKPFSPKDLLEIVEKLAGQGSKPGAQPEPMSANPPSATKFISQISSTQHMHKGTESFNLEWLDLSDKTSTKPVNTKVASLDFSTDDQGIVFDDDQYGLSRPQPSEEAAPAAPLPKDEDYEWFIGEIKREMEGKPRPEQTEKSNTPKLNTPSFGISAGEEIRFDDLRPAERNTDISIGDDTLPSWRIDNNPQPPDERSLPEDKIGSQPLSQAMSEDEISALADRVAMKLAAQIVANLDKNRLIDAIKTILKS